MSPRLLHLDQLNRPETSEPVEWSDARSTPGSPVSKRPTAGATLEEIRPLIGGVPVAGPPAVTAVIWRRRRRHPIPLRADRGDPVRRHCRPRR
jgi:hypothetical protein